MAILKVRKPDGTVQEIQTIVGPRGLKGAQGEKGEPGSNANVTNESVVAALGYTPANQTALASKQDTISDIDTIRSKANSAIQTETDPTVPSWAKADSKPTYNASEITYETDSNVGTKLDELKARVATLDECNDSNTYTKQIDNAVTYIKEVPDNAVSASISGISELITTIKVNGANLFDPSKLKTAFTYTDGTITGSFTATNRSFFTDAPNGTDLPTTDAQKEACIRLEPNTSYIVTYESNKALSVLVYEGDKYEAKQKDVPFTIGDEVGYLNLRGSSGSYTINDLCIKREASYEPTNDLSEIPVESGDSITFENAENQAVPSIVVYRIKHKLDQELSALTEEIAHLKNTGETTVASGKVWTSTADGAGWADAQGGEVWEKVIDETLTEETEGEGISIAILTLSSPLAIKKMKLILYNNNTPVFNGSSQGGFRANFFTATENTGVYLNAQGDRTYCEVEIEKCGDNFIIHTFARFAGYGVTQVIVTYMTTHTYIMSDLRKIAITANGTFRILSGTNVKVFAVRA